MTAVAASRRTPPKRAVPKRRHLPRRQPGPNVTVDVQDFGPIEKGSVDLRPLTVFVGPSNTGKSWMAVLFKVLGILPAIGTENALRQSMRRSEREDALRKCVAESGIPYFPKDLKAWMQARVDGTQMKLSAQEADLLHAAAESAVEAVEQQLLRNYGLPSPKDAVRQGVRSGAKIGLKIGNIDHRITIDKEQNNVSLRVDKDGLSTVDFSESSIFSGKHRLTIGEQSAFLEFERAVSLSDDKAEIASVWNIYAILEYMYGSARGMGRTHFLPADRGGIMHSHAAMVSSLVEGASYAGLYNGQALPVLSGVVSDFMKNVVAMAGLPEPSGNCKERFDMGLNENILAGEIKVESTEFAYPRFAYSPKGWSSSIPLAGASSMVSDVGSIAIFLRYFVKSGDLLIVEEPEAHLHPSLQCQMAREIVALVNSGVKVLLTTHSDWIVNELSNAVAWYEEANEDRGQQSLSKENIGVWLFDRGSNSKQDAGTSIQEVPWNSEDNGFEAGYYDVIVEQSNDWADAINSGAYRRRAGQ